MLSWVEHDESFITSVSGINISNENENKQATKLLVYPLIYINIQLKIVFYDIQQINSPMHLLTRMNKCRWQCPQFI